MKDGSAWCTLKIDNPKVWESVKNKTFEGVSLEGLFGMKQEFSNQEDKTLLDNSIDSVVDVILDKNKAYSVKYKAIINKYK